MRELSVFMNLTIFLSTCVIVALYFRKDGRWDINKGIKAMRFFTTLSNVFCAAAAILMAVCQIRETIPFPVWIMKYLGTAALTVTMLTVLLFLGPTMGEMGGYRMLLSGSNLYMHLLGPLLAIFSFCFLEKGEMGIGISMTGVVPVFLYGILYLYKIRFAPAEKSWEDFYGFNRGGKWPVSYAAMIAGTAAVCLILRIL